MLSTNFKEIYRRQQHAHASKSSYDITHVKAENDLTPDLQNVPPWLEKELFHKIWICNLLYCSTKASPQHFSRTVVCTHQAIPWPEISAS